MSAKSPMKKYWAGKYAPEMADAWFDYYKASSKESALDTKTKELVCVAVGSVMHCKHCVKAHAHEAIKAGATREEVAEAIMTAAFIESGSQLFWMAEELDEILEKG